MSRAAGTGLILNTRADIYRARTEAAFTGLPLPILHWPMFAPRPTGAAWPLPDAFDAVVFTSQIAVPLAPLAWRCKTAYAVGETTAAAARTAGFDDVIVTGRNAAQMIETLKTMSFRRALYPSAVDVAEDLAAAMPDRVTRAPVYAMEPEPTLPAWLVDRLRVAAPAIVPLFSRRAATHLATLARKADLVDVIDAIGISADVFETDALPWRVRGVAARPTLEAVVDEARRMIAAEVAP